MTILVEQRAQPPPDGAKPMWKDVAQLSMWRTEFYSCNLEALDKSKVHSFLPGSWFGDVISLRNTGAIACKIKNSTIAMPSSTHLDKESNRLHSILNSLREGVLVYDLNGAMIEANPAALALIELPAKDDIHADLGFLEGTYEVYTLNELPVPVDAWPIRRVLRGEELDQVEHIVVNKWSGRRWVSSHSGRLVQYASDKPVVAVLSIRDVTQLHEAYARLRDSEARLRMAFDSLPEQVAIFGIDSVPQYLNPAALQARAADPAIAVTRLAPMLADHVFRSGNSANIETRQAGATGWRDLAISAIPLTQCPDRQVLVTVRDLTEQKLAEERARMAVLHDPLTGLPNRALLAEYATHLFAAATRNQRHVAILFIDLDRFKSVNDLYGHAAGDAVLCEIGKRLLDRRRGQDVVARFGGDEFIVLLPDLAHPDASMPIAHEVLEEINRPMRIMDVELSMTASVGISMYPGDGSFLDMLVKAADAAMYRAKQEGLGSLYFYTEALEQRAVQRSKTEQELKRALANDALNVMYQPIVDADTERVVAAEALLRWPDHSIPPDVFIPIAEAAGLAGCLTDWVLGKVCEQQRAWQHAGLPPIPVAINVSPFHFQQDRFRAEFAQMLERHDATPSLLRVELTESAVVEDADAAIETLKWLRGLGFKIALDDFGKGYSSLSYLGRLPIDIIKIDRSFLQHLESDPASQAITDAILALGRSLQLHVIGEGIETASVLDYLRQRGCLHMQGYYFSEPLVGPAFASYSAQRK